MTDEIETTVADVKKQKAFQKAAQRSKKAKPKQPPKPAEKNAPEASSMSNDTTFRNEADAAPEKPAGAIEPHYFEGDDGLYFVGVTSTKPGPGTPSKPVYSAAVWICAPFKVKYRARQLDGMGWRFIIDIVDRDGNNREVTLLDSEIGGQDGGWHRTLADAGLRIHPKQRGLLAQYLLMECDTAPRARAVEKTGWCGDSYVMPNRTIGKSEEAVIYQGQDRTVSFGELGATDEWKEHVGRYCVGNSRLIVNMCAALAAPLLPLSGIRESGGIHQWGDSSLGKTTSLRVASSTWGAPSSYMSTWRNTANAIEGTAARCNHGLLCMDEIREAVEREIGTSVMMLGNGSGKGRMRDTAVLRERLTWLLLWLSTGEHKLTHYLEAAGLKADPGMEIRQIDLPADPGAGHGIYENLHGFRDGKALTTHLVDATERYYGAVGVAWLENIAQRLEEMRRDLPDEIARVALKIAPEKAESQVLRAVHRFALLAVAGEYATAWGLTGWKPGDATAGIQTCISAWIGSRGSAENLEEFRIIERFREFIGMHWSGRFIDWTRADDSHAPGKDQTIGFRNSEHFYITPEGWREIFKGMDPSRAAQVLLAREMLKPGTWKRGNITEERPYRREKLPGGIGRRQCYVTTPGVFDLLDIAQTDDAKHVEDGGSNA